MRVVMVPLHLIPESEVCNPADILPARPRRARGRRLAVLRHLRRMMTGGDGPGGLFRVACWVASNPPPRIHRRDTGYAGDLARHLGCRGAQAYRYLQRLRVHGVYGRLFPG